MSNTILYIANKNYSSWSMRAWLCARFVGLDFEEVIIPLRTEGTAQTIGKISPSKKVPCLHHDGLEIWDSLAIAEYLNELFPTQKLFSDQQKIRAIQRSIICEMHSSFMDLRKELPMNMKRNKAQELGPGAIENVNRILEIWRNSKKEFGQNGEFLFGEFSVVDAFFAPVISRFISYKIDVKDQASYLNSVKNYSLYQEWERAGLSEVWDIADFDR